MAGQHYAVPSTINGDVLLSAVMTVGSPTAARLGYQEAASRVHGALSPSTFDHGGTRTVTSLYADSLVTLLVLFDSALGAGKYNLHLGPTLLESDRLATSDFAGLVLLEDPPWQHGDTVDIRLVKATAPNMPTGLSATSSGTAQIDLEWTAPMDDGGRAVTAYKIEVSDDGSSGSWDDLVADTESADTEYSHTGLSAGQTRHYRVSAINAAGTSDASDSDDATTQRAAGNSQPEFDSSEDGRRSVAENDSGASVGSPLAATDGDSDILYFDLSGQESNSFEIDNSGQLSLKSGVSLNYEDDSSYSFDVTVSDRKDDNGDADTEVDDTLSVTVSVTNVDEDGTVRLSTNSPSEGREVTASLSDPDGSVSGTSWQWSRANSINGTYTNIGGATSRRYTPGDDDVDKFLRARVTYTDGHGSGKNASRKSTNAVSEEASVDIGGVVTLSARNPAVGVEVMATLLELDTPTSEESWQWSKSSSKTGTFTPISGANSSAYTPVTGDVGKYLKAKVEYTDSHGPNKSAEAVTVNAVAPEPETMENRPSEIKAYWDEPGHYDGNIMADCAGRVPFRAYWERPKRADEWEAEVTPEYGASNLSRDPIGYIGDGMHELTGTVHIRDGEFSVVSIRVRGRFGEDGWGAWSPVTELFCNPP